jgi:hypothetical protein
MGKNRFYALTFRKPGKSDEPVTLEDEADIFQKPQTVLSQSHAS